MTKIPTLNIAQSQSHIFLAHRIDINKAVIMIDIAAIDGMGVVQLADYATMRAFAATNPVNGDAAASTILGLFDPAVARPRELTDFDLAYLRTVYEGVDSLNAASKLDSINSKLRRSRRKVAPPRVTNRAAARQPHRLEISRRGHRPCAGRARRVRSRLRRSAPRP